MGSSFSARSEPCPLLETMPLLLPPPPPLGISYMFLKLAAQTHF